MHQKVILSVLLSLFLFSPERSHIKTTYTIGSKSAPDEIILFEEFACGPCQQFQKEIVPKIINDFVLTGKARLTIVPTAFLEESETAFAHAIAIINKNPDLLIPYLMSHANNEPLNESLPSPIEERDLDYAIDYNRSLLERRSKEEIYLPSVFINEKRHEIFDFYPNKPKI